MPRILAESGGGIAVPPDDPGSFHEALARLVDDAFPERLHVALDVGKLGHREGRSVDSLSEPPNDLA